MRMQHDDNFTARLRGALESGDVDAYAALLADDVRWGDTCNNRADVLKHLAGMHAAGIQTTLTECALGNNAVLVGFTVREPSHDRSTRERSVYQVLGLREGLIVDIAGYPSRTEAAEHAGLIGAGQGRMHVDALVPIVNVSSLPESFVWFEKLGWPRKWDWSSDGGEPSFGAVGTGELEICLCRDGQGGRGPNGTWLAIWTDDVDAVYARCVREGLEVVRAPADERWGVREMHVKHPDGHMFRIGQSVHHHHHPH
jgi:Glyoxalase/Bleomycin resistance protein/Dioxygenase superfamily/SnoaL-like domain